MDKFDIWVMNDTTLETHRMKASSITTGKEVVQIVCSRMTDLKPADYILTLRGIVMPLWAHLGLQEGAVGGQFKLVSLITKI